MISASGINAIDVLCIFIGVFILRQLLRRTQTQQGPLPPGPKGYPLIGNVLDMPYKREWETFRKWGQQYGKICSIRVLDRIMVILNSAEIAKEMLEKKSAIYSDRPVMQMVGNLIGWQESLPFMTYGNRFRRMRRYMRDLVGNKVNVQRFSDIAEVETHKFLRRVLANPEDFAQHIRHTAGAIITRITYGYEVKDNDDAFVDLADRCMAQFSVASTPGRFVVDVFPQLRHVPMWVPGAGFKRKAKEWAVTLGEMAEKPFIFAKKELAEGTAQDSFVSNLLAGKNVSYEEELDVKWSAHGLYAGGSDTTVSAIYSFFLAMALTPEVMRKAQAEIDSIVGNDRLPTLEDRQHLPYIDALIKEVFRWNVIVPLGLPHSSIEDDMQNGYFMPKGTIVIVNVHGILHDPEVYADPHKFDPERFIATEDRPDEPDPRNVAFGFGRRICPGMHLADASVFMSCAMILAVFDITKSVENGVVIEPVYETSEGTVSHPKPYRCSIKPRSRKAASLLD